MDSKPCLRCDRPFKRERSWPDRRICHECWNSKVVPAGRLDRRIRPKGSRRNNRAVYREAEGLW